MFPAAIAPALLLAFLAAGGCGNSEPDTTSFRVVLIEPLTNRTARRPCQDTIRVTFNRAIDTTAVFDVGVPRYFLASIQPSASFDSLGVFLTNFDRTLNLPFEFQSDTRFTFDFVLAQDQEGRQLESRAQTNFTTATSGNLGCP